MRRFSLLPLFFSLVPAFALASGLGAQSAQTTPAGDSPAAVHLARLTHDLPFDIEGESGRSFVAEKGEMVAVRAPWLYLVDGMHRAAHSGFSDSDVEFLSQDEVEKRMSKVVRRLDVLSVLHLARDPDAPADYVATVWNGRQLQDQSADPIYSFLGEWLLRPGRMVFLYNEGRQVGSAKIASWEPSATGLGLGTFRLAPEDLEFHQGQRLLVSFRKLDTLPIADTPKVTELMKDTNLLGTTGEGFFDSEFFASADLDNDGGYELLVRRFATSSIRFSIFERGAKGWAEIYRGGGR
ncbi:MAG TPA: hypothetical protein VGS22_17385 [Thermoanaerobaculia bacterium]|jgi:hypothetical protein|nr:hypothetical protein [Thermoanaerobaculia bacterium]